MPQNQFPAAKRCDPIYVVDGAIYSRVTAKQGQTNPNAIRALETLPNGEQAMRWLVPLDVEGLTAGAK